MMISFNLKIFQAGRDGRSQAPNSVKLRVMQYLGKSIAATNMVAPMIQVIFDGIYGDLTTAKLQRAAMSFLQWCARMVKYSKFCDTRWYSDIMLFLFLIE